jgi:hypothetical protein
VISVLSIPLDGNVSLVCGKLNLKTLQVTVHSIGGNGFDASKGRI